MTPGFCTALLLLSLLPAGADRLCGRDELTHAFADNAVAWRRRASGEPRYEHCKVLTARYNCSRFHTSASDYRLGWRTPGACALPTVDSTLSSLRRAPLSLLLLGDSHTMQVYQAALCLFQAHVRSVVAYTTSANLTRAQTFSSVAAMPECHSVPYADYPRFHLAPPASTAAAGSAGCGVKHAPDTPTCFQLAGSLVCAAQVRPLEGPAAVHAGLDAGLASLNLSLASFGVLAANTYISPGALGKHLAARAFRGRVLALPKFPAGAQTGLVLSDAVLGRGGGNAPASSDVTRFCAQLLGAWGSGECVPLQLGRLIRERTEDAKASIYPMTYTETNASTGAAHRVVCHADQRAATAHPGLCDRAGVTACDAVPCAEETHFCIPGPPDDFALVVLAAAA